MMLRFPVPEDEGIKSDTERKQIGKSGGAGSCGLTPRRPAGCLLDDCLQLLLIRTAERQVIAAVQQLFQRLRGRSWHR